MIAKIFLSSILFSDDIIKLKEKKANDTPKLSLWVLSYPVIYLLIYDSIVYLT